MVGETTCDGKKKMYKSICLNSSRFILWNFKPSDGGRPDSVEKEIIRFKEYLEEKFEIEITEEKIREAAHTMNEIRKSMKRLSALMAKDPAPATGLDMFHVMYGSGFKLTRRQSQRRWIRLQTVEDEYAQGKHLDSVPSILVTGCPIGGATEKVIKAIEDNGGVVVTFENCVGAKNHDRLVDEDNPDIYDALARRYLDIAAQS